MRLNEFPNLVYAVSNKHDGNLSYIYGDQQQAVQNRQKFFQQNGIDLKDVTTVNLVHGTNILKVTHSDTGNASIDQINNLPEADGLITNQPGVNLFILIADCIGVTLYDPKHSAIGLIHAGRVGLEKGVLTAGIEKMRQEYYTNPADLIAQFSPSIGPCCYTPAYPDKSPETVKAHIVTNQNGEFAMDIWTWAEDQLHQAGLNPKNITNPHICTYHSGRYFSYRQFQNEGTVNYRFATILGIKPQR